jgi:hypothetical protein
VFDEILENAGRCANSGGSGQESLTNLFGNDETRACERVVSRYRSLASKANNIPMSNDEEMANISPTYLATRQRLWCWLHGCHHGAPQATYLSSTISTTSRPHTDQCEGR